MSAIFKTPNKPEERYFTLVDQCGGATKQYFLTVSYQYMFLENFDKSYLGLK